jgi:dTDP-glucose 4,6-dehydratase
MRLLVTGGCGFIGSNFIRLALRKRQGLKITNLDALTYAGNLDNLRDVEKAPDYEFVKGSIVDPAIVNGIMLKAGFDAVVNFAAESHVDRSIMGALEFVNTNVQGTAVLLEAAKRHGVKRFLQVSTDEVYGSLAAEGSFREDTPLHPNNPYSATKAAADHLALAYHHTFGMDVVITRSSNNYGPFQFPEKFIPLLIANALEDKPIPIYGDGLQVRDWLYVEDNCFGILAVLEKGGSGDVYNLGGGHERTNLSVVRDVLALLGKPESLIQFVKDRPGHDRRYAIDADKALLALGFMAAVTVEQGLGRTVRWYMDNRSWIDRVRSGEYRKYYEAQYAEKA